MTVVTGAQVGDVDGVRAYWAPNRGSNQDSGVLRATLWFRYGAADLPLARHGWLHLLEHLALHGKSSARTPVNGHVDLWNTAFHVAGDPEDVTVFLDLLCRWLADPRLDHLEHEARVLRAEAGQRKSSATSRHLLWRFGAQGPGLADYDEFGLYTATATSLATLARQVYTRGNAVLALDGPPPAGLQLPLPDGPRIPVPTAVACQQPYPAGFTANIGGVAVSGTVARSTAAAACARLFEQQLHRTFRETHGVGYAAWSSYERIDTDTAVIAAGIDVLPEGRGMLVSQVSGLLARMSAGHALTGILTDDLADETLRTIRKMREAPAAAQPFAMAANDLSGGPVFTFDELIEQARAVTVDDIADAARTMSSTMLISVDPGEPHGGLPWLDTAPLARPAKPEKGREFRPVGNPRGNTTLTINDQWATLTGPSQAIAVNSGEVAAALAWADGGRILIRSDGYQLRVEPTLWRRGADAVELLDRIAGPQVRVWMPAREPGDIPRPPRTRRRRALARLRAILVTLGLFAASLLLGLLVVGVLHAPALVGTLTGVTTFFGTSRLLSRRARQAAARR